MNLDFLYILTFVPIATGVIYAWRKPELKYCKFDGKKFTTKTMRHTTYDQITGKRKVTLDMRTECPKCARSPQPSFLPIAGALGSVALFFALKALGI